MPRTQGLKDSRRSKYLVAAQMALAAIAFSSTTSFAANAPGYSIQQIGPSSGPTGPNNFGAWSINDAGYISGTVDDRAAIGMGVSFSALPTLGFRSSASHINNNNEAVGLIAIQGASADHAGYWHGDTAIDLHDSAAASSRASSINSHSQIVGWMTGGGYTGATIWENGIARSLGLPVGTAYSSASDINDVGTIVGWASSGLGNQSAVYWKDSTFNQLVGLGGSYASANAINTSGQIVGGAEKLDGANLHATLWVDGAVTDLGVLGGLTSVAFDINDAGYAVGRSTFADGNSATHAALWANSSIIDLNDYLDAQSKSEGWVLTDVTAINNPGQIIAVGRNSRFQEERFFLLSPTAVPEPANWMLMAAGCGLLLRTLRSRRAHPASIHKA